MCGYHWVCGSGRSPEPTGWRWSSPTTNEVIYTYISPDEGGFVFISYKREAYGQTEQKQMPWVFTYYEQCTPSPQVVFFFPPPPLPLNVCVLIDDRLYATFENHIKL